MQSGGRAETIMRAVSMVVTALTLASLADHFFNALLSVLLLVWKRVAGQIEAPVLGDGEMTLILWGGFGLAVAMVCGMGKRIRAVFCEKTARWYAVLLIPQFVVDAVVCAADRGASYGILVRSGGTMGLYYDQIFSYAGWGVLSALSLFAVVTFIFGMDRIWLEQKKNSRYQAQVAAYQMLEEQYSRAERLRHDLKNHVTALQGLWDEQAWERLGGYLEKMKDGAQFGINEEATGNRAVDALLYQKRQMAKEQNILWECEVQIPKHCPVNEFDLCVLFGNILDNALEACGRMQKGRWQPGAQPFIRVQAGMVKKCFLLEVKNSMDAAEKAAGDGIGLLNVRDVVRGHNGVMKVERKDGIFAVSILLPLAAAEYDMERAV
ncbi:MAG: GHKL domain-containing protein [Bacteroidales bacterium]|nr:GHKL domain-containing protein [Bacteroidales bacterium]MCM1416770.1 GHKL domain-containing protein [bacterium]MCM1424732.1 GHKL domain-containing protein [bacterium]